MVRAVRAQPQEKRWGFRDFWSYIVSLFKLFKYPFYFNLDMFNSQSNLPPPNDTTIRSESDSASAGHETSEEPTMNNAIDEKLQDLGVDLMDQDALERQIMAKVW